MGNLCSGRHDKDAVVRRTWTSHGAIPALPINRNLQVFRVLNKHGDGSYHEVGTVTTLSKPGAHKTWLQKHESLLPPKNVGNEPFTINDPGLVVTKLLIGHENANAWFMNEAKASSVEICIPECEELAFNVEKWGEMVQHLDPDMENPKLGPASRTGLRDLFIVLKVLLVTHITIRGIYSSGTELDDVDIRPLPSKGVKVEANVPESEGASSEIVREFKLSSLRKNQKLPVAFSAVKCTFDKYGVLVGRPLVQADSAEASSSHVAATGSGSAEADDDDGNDDDYEEDEDEDDEEEDELQDPAREALLQGDWVLSIISTYDMNEHEIYGPLSGEEEDEEDEDDEDDDPGSPGRSPPRSPPGSPPRDLEDID